MTVRLNVSSPFGDPTRTDWRVLAASLGLLFVALLVPETGRIGGVSPLGKAKAASAILAVFAPQVLLGHRRVTPLLAFSAAYVFYGVVHFGTGNWLLVEGSASAAELVAFALAFDVPIAALVVTAIGYPAGLVGGSAYRLVRDREPGGEGRPGPRLR